MSANITEGYWNMICGRRYSISRVEVFYSKAFIIFISTDKIRCPITFSYHLHFNFIITLYYHTSSPLSSPTKTGFIQSTWSNFQYLLLYLSTCLSTNPEPQHLVEILPTPHLCMLSHVRPSWPHGLQPSRLLCPWASQGKNAGVGCHFLLQGNPGILPNPGIKPASPVSPALTGGFFTTEPPGKLTQSQGPV